MVSAKGESRRNRRAVCLGTAREGISKETAIAYSVKKCLKITADECWYWNFKLNIKAFVVCIFLVSLQFHTSFGLFFMLLANLILTKWSCVPCGHSHLKLTVPARQW
jgi:hypothetical protein